jgi:hypothetical protein
MIGSGIVLSGIFMYLLGSNIFGTLFGITTSVLYMYAPYHAVQMYVRGAIGELWATAFFPLLALGMYYSLYTRSKFSKYMIGSLGLALPDLLAADERNRRVSASTNAFANDPMFGRAKRCVLLFLMGGPPQHDTWDPKPDAPAQIRGEFQPISTSVPGVYIGELFPLLAQQAHHYTIVRSVSHTDTTHTTAGYTMLTGMPHPTPGLSSARSGPRPTDHPHFGSVMASMHRAADGLPTFVTLPEIVKDAAVNEVPGQGAGFLGPRYAPFLVEANPQRTGFLRPAIVLPSEMSTRRLADRSALRELLNRQFDATAAALDVTALDGYFGQAFAMISSSKATAAFDLPSEPAAVREAYGSHLFGQGCLLARRLLEAGVRLVSVYWHYEGPDDSPVWDTHENNFKHLRQRLMPPADRAIAALLQELNERGMLEDTLVICMGEFGRSPKVNSKAGRDHWPHVQSIMLAGAGIHRGAVYGASDADGAYPAEQPVNPGELVETFLHLLAVPPHLELHDQFNRPFPATHGEVVRGLLA